MKITFLLTNPPNPRMQRRAKAFSSIAECSLSCIRRSETDIYQYSESLFTSINEVTRDIPAASNLFGRLKVFPDLLKIQMSSLNEIHPDVIYLQGLDCLVMACLYRKFHDTKVKIVYEVADLREAFFDGRSIVEKCRNRLIQRIEESLIKEVDLLVATSAKFLDLRYSKLIPSERTIEVPNIPNMEPFEGYQRKNEGEFVVGYVGVIRYLDQLTNVVDAAAKAGVKVIIAGGFQDATASVSFCKHCRDLGNVEITGKYNYETDIKAIYESFDCVCSVYDVSNPNVRIALPNKLYESVQCEMPLIVSRGTYLGEQVELRGIGASVNCEDVDEIYSLISAIKDRGELYQKMVDACKVAKQSDFMEDKTGQLCEKVLSLSRNAG